MKRIGLMLGMLTIASLFLVSNACAALIGVNLLLPDIYSDSTGVYSYVASTGLFTFTADADTITFDGVNKINITGTNQSYSASFYVDSSGNLTGGVGGNDLEIYGDIDVNSDSIPEYSGLLVAGEITNFGWLETGTGIDLFDYTFDFKSGELASFYATYGNKGGDVATSEVSTFRSPQLFSENFSGTKVKHDTAPIPEPASLLLLGSGLLGLATFGGLRKRKG